MLSKSIRICVSCGRQDIAGLLDLKCTRSRINFSCCQHQIGDFRKVNAVNFYSAIAVEDSLTPCRQLRLTLLSDVRLSIDVATADTAISSRLRARSLSRAIKKLKRNRFLLSHLCDFSIIPDYSKSETNLVGSSQDYF
jgi:hypothetical protein